MQWGLFSPKGLDSIYHSTARLNVWHGAVRSGKTICSIVRWLDYVKNGPPGELIMIGKTERTLKRNILDPIRDIVGKKRFHYNRGMGELKIFGRLIYIAGANDERSSEKIRGLTLAGAYCDELTLWPESMFQELLNRLSVKGAKLFATTNPDGPFHWLKVGYLDKAGLNLKQWHFELTDNPNLDPDYVDALKKEHTGVFYDRMIRGLWVLAEGVIYDAFDLNKHGFEDEEAPTFDRYDVAIDYGTQNAFAAMLIGVKGDCSYALKEYYYSGRDEQKQKTDAEYSQDIKEWLGSISVGRVFIDPSAASMIAQLKKDRIGSVKEADNPVVPGIRTVAGRLSNGKLKIHRKKCPNLVREFGLYSWDPKAGQRGEDKPLKINDHALDALRYHEHTLFGKTPGKVKVYEEGIY